MLLTRYQLVRLLMIIIGVPLAKKLLPLAVGAEVVPVSSAANAVIGTKLITIHSDRNAAKNFLFTCVFLLLSFYRVALGWAFFSPDHLRTLKGVPF